MMLKFDKLFQTKNGKESIFISLLWHLFFLLLMGLCATTALLDRVRVNNDLTKIIFFLCFMLMVMLVILRRKIVYMIFFIALLAILPAYSYDPVYHETEIVGVSGFVDKITGNKLFLVDYGNKSYIMIFERQDGVDCKDFYHFISKSSCMKIYEKAKLLADEGISDSSPMSPLKAPTNATDSP